MTAYLADTLTLSGALESAEDLPLEIVERKGPGHPDTICDGIADAVGESLHQHYRTQFGRALHYNVDKVTLLSGMSVPRFGGGDRTKPMIIILGGQATKNFAGMIIPVSDLANQAVKDWFSRHFPTLREGQDFTTTCAIHPGSADLVELFGRSKRGPATCGDSSIGIGFSPLTPTESLVLSVDKALLSLRERFPEIGLDTKILAIRTGKHCNLTIACAFVDQHVRDIDDYAGKKQRLQENLAALINTSLNISGIRINAADDFSRRSVYITTTGTSAECGDAGQVGRGNRLNGLITPCRPMTMEAFAGKNHSTHTGIIYQITAAKIANAIASRRHDVKNCECYLVSQIGSPVTEPAAIHLRVQSEDRGLAYETFFINDALDIVSTELEKLTFDIDQPR